MCVYIYFYSFLYTYNTYKHISPCISQAHLWEAISQVALWFSILLNTRLIPQDQIENLFEMCRRILESVGYRMNMDCILIFLVSSKAGHLIAGGLQLDTLNFSLGNLYQKPDFHSPLQSYWSRQRPLSQLQTAKRTLEQISELNIGSVMVLALLQELQLFLIIIDLENVKPS